MSLQWEVTSAIWWFYLFWNLVVKQTVFRPNRSFRESSLWPDLHLKGELRRKLKPSKRNWVLISLKATVSQYPQRSEKDNLYHSADQAASESIKNDRAQSTPRRPSQVPVVSTALEAEAVSGQQLQSSAARAPKLRVFLWKGNMGNTDFILSRQGRGRAINSATSCLSMFRAGSWLQVLYWGILPCGRCYQVLSTIRVCHCVAPHLLWRPWESFLGAGSPCLL